MQYNNLFLLQKYEHSQQKRNNLLCIKIYFQKCFPILFLTLQVGFSPSKKNYENPLKTIENAFYFIFKSSFRSQNI